MRFFWAYFCDLVIFILIVEAIRIWNGSFHGFLKTYDSRIVRTVLYALAFAQIFVVKWAANLPLKKEEVKQESDALQQLFISSLVTFALCDLVILMGFLLFLLYALRFDFYIFLGLSVFYMVVYFPKRKEWDDYLRAVSS